MQLPKEVYAKTESIIVVQCKLKIPSLGITVGHHNPRDIIFNPLFNTCKDYFMDFFSSLGTDLVPVPLGKIVTYCL